MPRAGASAGRFDYGWDWIDPERVSDPGGGGEGQAYYDWSQTGEFRGRSRARTLRVVADPEPVRGGPDRDDSAGRRRAERPASEARRRPEPDFEPRRRPEPDFEPRRRPERSAAEPRRLERSAGEPRRPEPSADEPRRRPVLADRLERAVRAADPVTSTASPELIVAAPTPATPTIPARRTVTITGRGAEGHLYAAGRRPVTRSYERAGFKPDRIAMWAVLLGVLMILAAATSAHAAMLH